MIKTLSDAAGLGFVGFASIHQLRESRLAAVPKESGVYLVLRPDDSPPVLLPQSTAGFVKGRDPAVPLAELAAAWVEESAVLYIGKAGGEGGRAIWQLANAAELLIAWRVTGPEVPRDAERELIAEFVKRFGRRPFANRAG